MTNQEIEFKYVGSIRRSFANAIDMLLANLIRIALIIILTHIWLTGQIIKFREEFKAKFDSEVIGQDPEKIKFLLQHSVFKSLLLFCLIIFISGALYYILLNSSKWRATVGKKLMKIIIIKENGDKLTFLESLSHYLLSILPWFFIIYIVAYYMMHGGSLYNAITGNLFNLILGLCSLAWLQVHLVTQKKTTAPDMICKTIVVDERQ